MTVMSLLWTFSLLENLIAKFSKAKYSVKTKASKEKNSPYFIIIIKNYTFYNRIERKIFFNIRVLINIVFIT